MEGLDPKGPDEVGSCGRVSGGPGARGDRIEFQGKPINMRPRKEECERRG